MTSFVKVVNNKNLLTPCDLFNRCCTLITYLLFWDAQMMYRSLILAPQWLCCRCKGGPVQYKKSLRGIFQEIASYISWRRWLKVPIRCSKCHYFSAHFFTRLSKSKQWEHSLIGKKLKNRQKLVKNRANFLLKPTQICFLEASRRSNRWCLLE